MQCAIMAKMAFIETPTRLLQSLDIDARSALLCCAQTVLFSAVRLVSNTDQSITPIYSRNSGYQQHSIEVNDTIKAHSSL